MLASAVAEACMAELSIDRESEDDMANYEEMFRQHRHLVLSALLTEPLRNIVHQYALKRSLHSPETSWGSAIRGTPVFYGDPLAETLLELFESVGAEFSGLDLDLTYAELFVFGRSSVANPARARDAAEIRLTVHVGTDGDGRWPILLDIDGEIIEIELAPGDALLHRPSTDPVAREPLADGHVVELQLNYVDKDGPHAQRRLDGRHEVGALPSTRDIALPYTPLRRSGFVQEIFDDEILVHYPGDDVTFAINLTAGLVWAQCDGESTPDQIIERLKAAFPDGSENIADDVTDTLAELHRLGAIEPL